MYVPRIASPWQRIVYYPRHHLNDFCLFRDADQRWHALGIKGSGTWASEQSLFHAVGNTLEEPFENLPDVLVDRAPEGVAPQKHAPFVVLAEGTYHLFYRRPNGTILVLRSDDPFQWSGLGDPVFECRDARDLCILRPGDVYFMYYCQSKIVDGIPRSTILLRKSPDLYTWSEPTLAHVDTIKPADHSYLESPFVIARPEGYYLFARHRLFDDRRVTSVYFSADPERFPSGERAWFAELEGVHAPEILVDDEQYYIARVTGPAHAGRGGRPDRGSIDIARLSFT